MQEKNNFYFAVVVVVVVVVEGVDAQNIHINDKAIDEESSICTRVGIDNRETLKVANANRTSSER